MKSKLALVLIAAAGSAALAAAAQTQSPSSSEYRPTYLRTPTSTSTKTDYVITQDEPSSVTVSSPAQRQGTAGTRVSGVIATPGVGTFSGSTSYGNNHPLIPRMWISGEEASIAQEADQLARQLGEAKSDSDRDKIKAKLGEVLEKQFEQRQKRHESELAELEAQVKKLKDLVARRQENRREIVARRLEQVLRESQGLGW